MKSIILFLFFLLTKATFSQVEIEHYFSALTDSGRVDHLYSSVKMNDGVIIAATIDSGAYELPAIIKLDLNGEVIWSTFSAYTYACGVIRRFNIQYFEEGFIYGYISVPTWGANFKKRIWKVNVIDGSIEWVNTFYSIQEVEVKLCDYDSTTFINTYIHDEKMMLSFMDKSSGDTIETFDFGDETEFFDVNVDYNKNIYLSKDSILSKYNGKDFDQRLWQRSYLHGDAKIQAIKRIYIDAKDKIYLLGGKSFEMGSDANAHISSSDGNLIWSSSTNDFYFVDISDFEDRNGMLYITYSQLLVGGGVFLFSVSKTDKENGEIIWNSELDFEPIGELDIDYGDHQAGLSIATDCSGDVFTTGYYGGYTYNEGIWGTMRLDEGSGEKVYEVTIIDDSSNVDEVSSGKFIDFFGNHSIILGHQEDSTSEIYTPFYVSLDHSTGEVIAKTTIGIDYSHSSKTIDFQYLNDSLFVLKQQGNKVLVECYAPFDALVWQTEFGDSTYIQGNQFKIANESLFLAISTYKTDSIAPYYSDSVCYITSYQLNKSTGSILDQDSIFFEDSFSQFVELETDEFGSFLFYAEDSLIKYRKWISSEFSEPHSLEFIGENISYEGGMNIVYNYGPEFLYFIGEGGLYEIDKSTLENEIKVEFEEYKIIYDFTTNENKIYLCGTNEVNDQTITAIDLTDMTIIWESIYDLDATFFKIRNNSENLLVVGGKDQKSKVYKINIEDGALVWDYTFSPILYPNTIPYVMEYNALTNKIFMSGTILNDDGHFDIYTALVEPYGEVIYTSYMFEGVGINNVPTALVSLDEDRIILGGTINTSGHPKSGFINQIKLAPVVSPSEVEVNILSNFRTFPNPSNGSFTIDFGNISTENKILKIYDSFGQIVFQENAIDVPQVVLENTLLSNGLYFVVIYDQIDGMIIYTNKLIIN